MIRACLIGFGMAGRVFHGPLLSSVDGIQLAAVVERSSSMPSRATPASSPHRTLESTLADPTLDFFVVATPSGTHFEVARQVLLAGRHVVVDKPMSTTAAEIAQLIQLAQAGNLHLIPFLTDAGTATSGHFLNCSMRVCLARWFPLNPASTAGVPTLPPRASGKKTPPRAVASCSISEPTSPTRL